MSRANFVCIVRNAASSFHSGKILQGRKSGSSHDCDNKLTCLREGMSLSYSLSVPGSTQLTEDDEFAHLNFP